MLNLLIENESFNFDKKIIYRQSPNDRVGYHKLKTGFQHRFESHNLLGITWPTHKQIKTDRIGNEITALPAFDCHSILIYFLTCKNFSHTCFCLQGIIFFGQMIQSYLRDHSLFLSLIMFCQCFDAAVCQSQRFPLFLPLLLSHYLSTQYMFTLSHLPIHLLFRPSLSIPSI